MPRFARCLGLLTLGLAIAMPALGDDKPSPSSSSSSSPGSDTEKPVSKDKFVYVARLQGTVTSVDTAQGTIVLLVHYKAPNQAAFQKMAQLQMREMQQEMQVMQSMMRQMSSSGRGRRNYSYRGRSNPQGQLNNTVRQMAQTAPKLYDDKTKLVDLMLAEDVDVRVAAPPEEFDDKGKRKTYSPEELKTLKGNTKLWGYPGSLDQLQVGHIVQVFAARKKIAHPPGHKETAEEFEENPPLIKVLYLSPAPPQPVATNTTSPKPAPKKK